MTGVSPLFDELVYLWEVIPLVKAHVLRLSSGRLRPLYRHALEGRLGQLHVVRVRPPYGQPDRYAVPIDEHAPLRS